MSDITASLGVSQMKKIEQIIRMRRDCARFYLSKLSSIPGISVQVPPAEYFHVYQLFSILLDNTRVSREEVITRLHGYGIATKVFFPPVHLTKFYRESFGYSHGDVPVTEKIADRILSLPIFPTLQKDELMHICSSLVKILAESTTN